MKEKDGWTPINRETFDTVSNPFENFLKSVTNINDAQNIKRLFQAYPVTYNIYDSFFYKLGEDNSYILAISNTKEQKLFVMEWIQ
ncbi:hypothetical protein [Psychrobacillus soli]|uniref:Uncharacterized protein n=1 Tax=Psychrobacillus soli TaxID=1543965 RepID=A0A544TK11_9BACI|nr:hypothetical protein [Psychrobacillus soli]TQR17768.1 hypothetical protein FG383_04185 [Psychrobacillus soli]